MLVILDILLEIIHILLIVFNLTGWIVPGLRLFHFISLNTVFFLWFVAGYFYGWGYCPLTDIHWKIKASLGYRDLPYSYIAYLLEKAGIHVEYRTVDYAVVFVTVFLYFISLYFFLRKYGKRISFSR